MGLGDQDYYKVRVARMALPYTVEMSKVMLSTALATGPSVSPAL